jgi:hypothetical protein
LLQPILKMVQELVGHVRAPIHGPQFVPYEGRKRHIHIYIYIRIQFGEVYAGTKSAPAFALPKASSMVDSRV